MEMFEEYLAQGGWAPGKGLDHHVDRVVAQYRLDFQ
jgi:hypothetical protein